MHWQPMEVAPVEDYNEIIVVVRTSGGDLDHRIAMWDPENEMWTVWMANWNPIPLCWMPLPPLPTEKQIDDCTKGQIHAVTA